MAVVALRRSQWHYSLVLGVTDLSAYLLGLVLLIVLPGPNSLYVASVAARRGVREGYRAVGGVFAGDSALMFLSAAGVASLLQANETLFSLVRLAGAVYLAYLALGMLLSGWRIWRSRRVQLTSDAPAVTEAPRRLREHPFRRALVVSLLNPKAILFFVAFFVQFVDPAYPYPWLSFLVLGTFAQAGSILYLSALIFGGARLSGAFRRRRRLAAAVSGAVGAIFLLFATRLALGG